MGDTEIMGKSSRLCWLSPSPLYFGFLVPTGHRLTAIEQAETCFRIHFCFIFNLVKSIAVLAMHFMRVSLAYLKLFTVSFVWTSQPQQRIVG